MSMLKRCISFFSFPAAEGAPVAGLSFSVHVIKICRRLSYVLVTYLLRSVVCDANVADGVSKGQDVGDVPSSSTTSNIFTQEL